MVQVNFSPPVCGSIRLRQSPRSIVTVLIETCRRVRIPIRNYLASILPGLADLPVKRVLQNAPHELLRRESRPTRGTNCLTCPLANSLAGVLVLPDPEKHRLTKAVIARPLREFDLAEHFGFTQ
jgi:hypothetical protein